MRELPRIKYEETNYLEKLDEIFSKLLKYEDGYSEELVTIRKKQILNHSRGFEIADILNSLSNLIGTNQDQSTDIIMKMSFERLIECHSPVIFNVPFNAEPFHKWEEWTFAELYDKYMCIVMSKGWEDFYSLPKDFSKNKHVTNGRLDFDVDYDLIKNYHIIDMLNDLVINDYLICGYDIRSFMNTYDGNRLLNTFNKDCLIDVKLKEKYILEELNKRRV